MALQQPSLPDGSNSTEMLDGGWPAYEFSDGSATFPGLARKANGDPSIRLYVANDGGDAEPADGRISRRVQRVSAGQSVAGGCGRCAADGADGDGGVFRRWDCRTSIRRRACCNCSLIKTIDGYTFIDFETTVKGIGIAPGDLITVTYIKEGLERQPFRVMKLAPGQNYQTVQVTAQWHDDAWYTTGAAGHGDSAAERRGVGTAAAAGGERDRFAWDRSVRHHGDDDAEGTDGIVHGRLSVAFTPPASAGATGRRRFRWSV